MGRFDRVLGELGLAKQKYNVSQAYAGTVDGYYMIVEIRDGAYSDNSFTLRVGMQTAASSQMHLDAFRNKLIQDYKIQAFESNEHVLAFKGRLRVGQKKNEEHIKGVIQSITDYLRTQGIGSGDFANGDTDPSVSLYKIGTDYHFLSDRSYREVSADLQSIEQKLHEEMPERSIVTGLGGAILGALIGAVLWAVLLYFGYYAWFAAILSTSLAFYFYEKQKGIITPLSSVLITVIVLLSLVAANILMYAFIFKQGLAEFNLSFGSALINLPELLREFDLMPQFLMDLFLGIGIAILFSAFLAFRLYKGAKNKNKIMKV